MSSLEVSGPGWCDLFQTSTSLEDLAPEFRRCVARFIAALRDAGAAVQISATYRPVQRAYLMHWCCMIADGGQDPAAVPSMDGVPIDWTHGGDRAAAKAAARAMKAKYSIRYPAALVSRHTQRRAIDMTITWQGIVRVRDANDHRYPAASLSDLYSIGASYGVHKLEGDRPHWSDDGH